MTDFSNLYEKPRTLDEALAQYIEPSDFIVGSEAGHINTSIPGFTVITTIRDTLTAHDAMIVCKNSDLEKWFADLPEDWQAEGPPEFDGLWGLADEVDIIKARFTDDQINGLLALLQEYAQRAKYTLFCPALRTSQKTTSPLVCPNCGDVSGDAKHVLLLPGNLDE